MRWLQGCFGGQNLLYYISRGGGPTKGRAGVHAPGTAGNKNAPPRAPLRSPKLPNKGKFKVYVHRRIVCIVQMTDAVRRA